MASKTKKILYKCPQVKKKVLLEVEQDIEPGFLGSKVTAQQIKSCDLHDMGGCKLHPERFDSKCPATAQAAKCALK